MEFLRGLLEGNFDKVPHVKLESQVIPSNFNKAIKVMEKGSSDSWIEIHVKFSSYEWLKDFEEALEGEMERYGVLRELGVFRCTASDPFGNESSKNAYSVDSIATLLSDYFPK